ncbi:D-alanyl-D-alanine carboxypeptidase (DacC) [Fructobacillus evanidus]|uniref:D-alanyl-D-alanine carboxypeptidase (DacC) n=2 Tax=Fructobacillus evanidus TaxID=3064281 RepID=A0ABM9MMC7_9LACO|nr:D-alanyl-D-alanine carboxypeptidase (DacC) [Fructobacillus sp. LMG 32999]CAK1222305.1 D-alanyl-D-alanine carboxypeptidase (DacC) [Fructobacillus sp. LMG 32999]CAK1225255.1 D-alanyl-D-alanine carboxypeptidase (DacC) [Fructobacillus sp. LMG 32999]CAK1225475.1 D-alanyl-D-alanine carboxypeptidase (DacC) [Fructobacillus sp. LMG 32999]CAK1225654.1 D-alanyl-D-alanine carboxypeptidase (DacC) [Fructobacillus sp. LMG 32999]
MWKRKQKHDEDDALVRPSSRLALFQNQTLGNLATQKKVAMVGAVLVLILSIILTVAALENNVQTQSVGPTQTALPMTLQVAARNAIVIDAKTGQVLGEKGADKQIGIASQSKMLTAYGILQGIKKKRFTWDSLVTITQQSDWSKKDNATFSHLEISVGQKLAVKELFAAMFTSSANDAALALADFAKEQNQTQQQALEGWAKDLKLTGSKWYNAAGQVNKDASDYQVKDANPDAENTASIRQLAILAYQVIREDPTIRSYYEKRGLVYHPSANETKIKLTEGAKFDQEIKAKLSNPKNLTFEGLKTGSTPASGGALTGLIKDQNGHEFITVVSGAGRYTDQVQRYQNTVDVVNQVLDHYTPVTYQKGQAVTESQFKNKNLAGGHQSLVVGQSRTFWLTKGRTAVGYQRPSRLQSIVTKKGATVLTVQPTLKAKFLPEVNSKEQKLQLVNQQTYHLGHWWQRIYHWLKFW